MFRRNICGRPAGMYLSILFPGGTDELEAYQWKTDWTNYSDDGHEWWGTACRSICGHCMNKYVAIMASAAD